VFIGGKIVDFLNHQKYYISTAFIEFLKKKYHKNTCALGVSSTICEVYQNLLV
jgi:hypothetical protein